jgi:hypothetical protein
MRSPGVPEMTEKRLLAGLTPADRAALEAALGTVVATGDATAGR